MQVQTYPWHGKVVIITPVECHWCGHIRQQVFWRSVAVVVLPVDLRISPVVGMEPGHLLLLGVVEDGVGAGACGGVVEDVRQQGLVHLEQRKLLQFYTFWFCLVTYLSFIKTTKNKENVGAESLSDFSFMTEQACKTVNQEAIRKKLSYSHETQKPLVLKEQIKYNFIKK